MGTTVRPGRRHVPRPDIVVALWLNYAPPAGAGGNAAAEPPGKRSLWQNPQSGCQRTSPVRYPASGRNLCGMQPWWQVPCRLVPRAGM